MKLSEYKKGDRVKVPHGTGTIVGFERFYMTHDHRDGQEAPMSEAPNDTGDRAFVKLEPGHTWACGHKWPDMLYGAWDTDMEKLPDSDLTNSGT